MHTWSIVRPVDAVPRFFGVEYFSMALLAISAAELHPAQLAPAQCHDIIFEINQ